MHHAKRPANMMSTTLFPGRHSPFTLSVICAHKWMCAFGCPAKLSMTYLVLDGELVCFYVTHVRPRIKNSALASRMERNLGAYFAHRVCGVLQHGTLCAR